MTGLVENKWFKIIAKKGHVCGRYYKRLHERTERDLSIVHFHSKNLRNCKLSL